MSGVVIAEWVFGGSRHRLVEIIGARWPDDRKLERCDRDAAGGDKWVDVPFAALGANVIAERALAGGVEELARRAKRASEFVAKVEHVDLNPGNGK